MFSPETSGHTHSLRPKRNRQAAGNDDSVKLPQAKRKRSALRRDTFVEPLAEASLNEIAGRETNGVKTNGHVPETKAIAAAPSVPGTELSIRGGKRTDKRAERGAGALTLASNDFYNISQLPCLPDQVRTRPSVPYTCVLSPEYGYALALTHTDALIWPYSSSTTTPSSRDVVTFKLPLQPSSASDPLPLATFTARSAGGEPGILVVSPKWGKIVYWETLTNASTIIPGQTSVGVPGSIPGMLSGETVQDLVNAEPAGFIITFSHGRLAHVSVRDQLGRPSIGVQFLRKSSATSNGGIYGSIRNLFGGDRRKGTPIVRPGSAAKGQRNVVVITEDAEMEVWDTNLGAGHALIAQNNFKETLLNSLTPQIDADSAQPMQFKILDFELVKPRQELARKDQPAVTPLIVLLSITKAEQSQYFLVEMSVSKSETNVKVVHPIKCYETPISESGSWRPRLSVSAPQSMAFVVFETAIVLFSLAKIKESPSSQLLGQALPDPFQDCIHFQEQAVYKVLGYTADQQSEQATWLVAVQAFGIIRVTSTTRSSDDIDVDDYQERITAKSKIEQAVFFGTLKQNPLDLTTASGSTFSAAEISNAALEISSEILASTSKFLPRSGPSIDMQMKLRAKGLDDLIQHLMKQYGGLLSRDLRYKLLWKAEKLAAAQALWKVQEEIQRRYPLDDREKCYLDFTLKALHQDRQKYPDEEKGEKDRVRHWLLNSVERIDKLLVELADCTTELEPMDVTNPKVVGEYLIEAHDLWITAYNAAFKFREDNAQSYGLGDDVFENGILVAGYPPTAGIPWTSGKEPLRWADKLISRICAFLGEWWDFSPENAKSKRKKMPVDMEGKPHSAPPKSLLNDIASRLPALVKLFTNIASEEILTAIRHVEANEKDPIKRQLEIAEIKAEKRPRMNEAVEEIARFNPAGAIELGERLKDPGLLVTLTTDYLKMLHLDSQIHPENTSKNAREIRDVQNHAETYYDRFGNGWAYANFSRKVENGELGSLLGEAQVDNGKKQAFVTWFLKKGMKRGQSLGKISWINDVIGEENYSRAEKTLSNVAENSESDLGHQRIEFSLAKLALLANDEARNEAEGTAWRRTELTAYDEKLDLINIQDRISLHLMFNVGATIDEKAAEDIATQEFAKRVVEKTPALKKLLIAGLRGILHRRPLTPEQLIDVLTLMDPVGQKDELENHPDPDFLGSEFFLALKVVGLANISMAYKEELRKMVWRRACVRDDWNVLNDTTGLDDQAVEERWEATSAFRTLGHLFVDRMRREAEAAKDGKSVEGPTVEEQIVSPGQILETSGNAEGDEQTANVLPSVLQERFFDEKEKAGVRKDLEREQGKVREYVDKAQLELHFSGLVSSAERLVKGEVEELDDDREEVGE